MTPSLLLGSEHLSFREPLTENQSAWHHSPVPTGLECDPPIIVTGTNLPGEVDTSLPSSTPTPGLGHEGALEKLGCPGELA